MFFEKEKIYPLKERVAQATCPDASSWVEVDRKALDYNLGAYKTIVGSSLLAPVIKSNAYGHGLEQVATVCDANQHVDMMCVVSLQEALALRLIGIKKPIIVVSIVVGNLEEAVENTIDMIAYDIDTVLALNAIGKKLNKKAHIHVKVDTGLSRLGLFCQQAYSFIKQIHVLPFITIQGIFTHLAESESEDQDFTNEQLGLFSGLVERLENEGISIPLRHAACSAAATMNEKSIFTAVRVGIGIYGLWASEDTKRVTGQRFPQFSLRPALTWKTRIIQVKHIPAGSWVGYDRTHYVDRPTTIATLPVGYWDGYDRRLSNKGHAFVQERLAPILGRIAMNLCMIDVTGLDVGVGDEVTLLGNHPGVTADDLAATCQTINYEFVTRINPLLPRILIS